ncbi:MAG: MSHA pilin protein MshC [Alteromonadaceae bacterium]|jgi:MSHA pilin protein MshC
MQKQHAFTMIELIVIIVILGILAVSVAPKLIDESEFSALATQDQYIAHLRLVQLKALNNRTVCHNSVFDVGNTVFGIPTNVDAACGTTTAVDSRVALGKSTITLLTSNPDKVAPTIAFNVNGIPIDAVGVDDGDCAGACKFSISVPGSTSGTLYICIESQGYIHKVSSTYACN